MKHRKMMYTYCGIDSHKGTHYAVLLDCFFDKLGEMEFKNSPTEFETAIKELEKFKVEGTRLLFGLEDTTSYGRSLAVFLINHSYPVKHVNSSYVASERKSLNTLQKTDSIDAECAARILLSKLDTLEDADPQDKYFVLKSLVIRRREIIKMNISLKNQLHAYIFVHYPSYHRFFCEVESRSSLSFYNEYPSPRHLEGVTTQELAEFLKEVSNSRLGIKKAEAILNYVKKDGNTEVQFQDMRDSAVRSIIRQLNSNSDEVEKLEELITQFLDNFDYKLTSMKGIGTVTAAELIVEIGDISRFPTPAKLAKYAAVAPVTYASGKSDVQYANQRGDRMLNSIFYALSVSLVREYPHIVNPLFNKYYHKKLSEGKTKHQSLKCVQRRLVNIIWGMMTYKTEYINPPIEKK